jgi:hypothetical protein
MARTERQGTSGGLKSCSTRLASNYAKPHCAGARAVVQINNTRSFVVVIFGSRPAYVVHDDFAKKKLVCFVVCDNAVNEPGASYIRKRVRGMHD